MLLPRSRYDEGVEILKAVMRGIAVRRPAGSGHLCGPVISSAKQRDRVISATSGRASTRAPTLLVGGTDGPPDLDKGFFVEPTLFVDVDNSMTIAQEEIFGPVLVVIPYDDDDDAVRIANDSSYGLAGGRDVGLARAGDGRRAPHPHRVDLG